MRTLFLVAASLMCLIIPNEASNCANASVGLPPLIDQIGLYPSGTNVPLEAHLKRGQKLAASLRLRPVNVFMSVGMSNTNQKFEVFLRSEFKTTDKAHNLLIVNGARGKLTSDDWADPTSEAYAQADQKLAEVGATPHDVGVLWVLVTNAATGDFPVWRAEMLADTRSALNSLASQYPNVQLIFLSSRVYGGYDSGGLNPEPFAYASGVVMRELIAEHLKGLLLPNRWIGWGPYLWADGMKPRSDGLIWTCSDFQSDGVHPSATGAKKVAARLSSFVRSDAISRIWFLQAPSIPLPPTGRGDR